MPEVDPSLGPRAATRRLALLGGSAPMYLRAREVHSLVAATHSHVRPQCIRAANAPRAHTQMVAYRVSGRSLKLVATYAAE